MALGGLISGISNVLGSSGLGSGLGSALGSGLGSDSKSSDSVSVTSGPITQRTGGGDVIFEKTDTWIWLMALAVLAVALFVRK